MSAMQAKTCLKHGDYQARLVIEGGTTCYPCPKCAAEYAAQKRDEFRTEFADAIHVERMRSGDARPFENTHVPRILVPGGATRTRGDKQ